MDIDVYDFMEADYLYSGNIPDNIIYSILSFLPNFFSWFCVFLSWFVVIQVLYSVFDLILQVVVDVEYKAKQKLKQQKEVTKWRNIQKEIINKGIKKRKTDYLSEDDGAFLVRKKVLMGKIKKLRDAISQQSCVNLKKYAFSAPDSHLFSSDENKTIWNCYDTLLQTDPQNYQELEETEWLFNNGKLRTEQEIFARHQFLKKRKYLQENFSYDRAKVLSKKIVANTIYNDIFWLLVPVVALLLNSLWNDGFNYFSWGLRGFFDIVPDIIFDIKNEFRIYESDLNEKMKYIHFFYYYTLSHKFDIGIPLLFGMIGSLLILFIPRIATSYETDVENKEAYIKAGQKPPIITESIALAGTYALVALTMYNALREKK